ncbi:MAG: uL15 family ribosomal protein [Candidatus Azambacteria bacterium]|nr:uL15 family ribosomal protein [Candidatus Azambacteria bacterium]
MQLHNIKPSHKSKKKKRVARGGKRGGYSGRGSKGQKSRAGAKIRPAIRDLIVKFPKQRGRAKHSFKSLVKKAVVFNLKDLEKNFKNGEIVSPATLLKKKLITGKESAISKIKILGEGAISKKLAFHNVLLSKSARVKIEKAGGTIK